MQEQYDMVRDCESSESRLSEREATFIADIGDRLESAKPLTENQAKKLESIWNKATEEG